MRLRFLIAPMIWLLAAPALAQQVAAAPLSDAHKANTATLIEKAADDEVGIGFVRDLTTEVGPRLAGSEQERIARDWSVAKLTELGFSNVRIETFEIPYWARRREGAKITSPTRQKLYITAIGGSTSTPEGGLEAEIVRFSSLNEMFAAPDTAVAGKMVFIDEPMTRTQDGSGYGQAVAKRRACIGPAIEKGALACLIRSVGTQTRRFPHTGMGARGEETGPGPVAALSPPDADQLTRLLEKGPVSVKLDLEVETKAKVESGNVIAEIPGVGDLADEIVLLGCHLDSWDLGTGAIDDGAGCGIVVGAAKLVDGLDSEPRRTIRVVLYGAEEVGLLGGTAYAIAHEAELGKHVFASESDFGADRIWQFSTNFGDGALGYARAMQDVLAPLGILRGNNSAGGGPDIGVLRRGGVPVVTPRQNGLDYFDLHHTPDDTFDKIDPDDFNQNVAAYAAFTYLAAYTGWDFRKAAEETVAGE